MSKYLESIQAAIQAAGDGFVLPVDKVIIEPIQRELKTKSGIVIAEHESYKSAVANKMVEAVVVAVGAGFYDEDTGEDVPLDVKVGDVVFVDPPSVRYLVSFPIDGYSPQELGMINEGQIQLRFKGQKALEKFRSAGAGAEVEVRED